jgi:L-alanine-DL-glutamate epimerase-like enolase superfamily enzyme
MREEHVGASITATSGPGGDETRSDIPPVRLRAIEAIGIEVPLPATVTTPIGSVANVVSLLVRATDEDGTVGWGEIWCNFPRFGLHHRARLLRDVVAPMLVGRMFPTPVAAFGELTRATRVLALQAGEPGPIAAVVGGIDIALWDIAAKKAAQPLWRLLGAARSAVETYASLGWAAGAIDDVRRLFDTGLRAFKLRSAGDADAHLAVAREARTIVGDDCALMLDLNSSWGERDAIAGIHALAPAKLAWLEEPVPADAAAEVWAEIAESAPMPLAGGENLIGAAALRNAVDRSVLSVLQPDMTKWGGFSGLLPVARAIVASGRRFCPHMFGGAVGTLASAHLLAASHAPNGLLEWGVNFHPLRDAMMARSLRDGVLQLDDPPGLGVREPGDLLARHRVA